MSISREFQHNQQNLAEIGRNPSQWSGYARSLTWFEQKSHQRAANAKGSKGMLATRLNKDKALRPGQGPSIMSISRGLWHREAGLGAACVGLKELTQEVFARKGVGSVVKTPQTTPKPIIMSTGAQHHEHQPGFC